MKTQKKWIKSMLSNYHGRNHVVWNDIDNSGSRRIRNQGC